MVCNELHYLKDYRIRAGVTLKDMAYILNMDEGNLSRMESGKSALKVSVAIAYYLILGIPFRMMLKNHYPAINAMCLGYAFSLKESILVDEENHAGSPSFKLRTRITETIIDRLVDQRAKYEEN